MKASAAPALAAALLALACSCATAPVAPTAPFDAGQPVIPTHPQPPPQARLREFTLHDLLTREGAVPADGMSLLSEGKVGKDTTEAEGGRQVHAVIFGLVLGNDSYMVLRKGVVEGARERVFLYALFKVGESVALVRAWRDDSGRGTFTPVRLEGDIDRVFAVPR